MEIRKLDKTQKNKVQFRQTDFETKKQTKTSQTAKPQDSENLSKIQTTNSFNENQIVEEISAKTFENLQSTKNVPDNNTANKEIDSAKVLNVDDGSKISKDKNSNLQNKSELMIHQKGTTENIHKNHRKNLKNQFLQNKLSYLTDVQKLELLLFFSIPQKDTNPTAHRLINTFGSLKNVFNTDFNKLIEVNGIKENSALLIKLVNSFYPFINSPDSVKQINCVGDAREFCSKLFVGVDVEEFYVICLSKNNQIKKVKMIQSGSADEIVVQIRNITEFTLSEKCNRIIITHNHPNGKGAMSDEDCGFTYSLICSCMLNSIEVIDHIIVGTDTSISLASQHILQKLKESAFNALNISKEKQLLISNASKEYLLDEE